MKDDIAIARGVKLRKIIELAKERLGIDGDDLEPYGHYKAKLSDALIARVQSRPDGKLILVTAISPTPAGEGKTTTTVGLGDALNAIGKKAMICVREPSLGPCFGVKGGGAGGGHSQVAPMEDINLHFTGDFHAVSIAHNLLAALVDNHIYFGNTLGFDIRRPVWRRVLDMNDRSLRHIVNGLGGTANGFPRETGYDIVAASEIMAILCLSTSLNDMRDRFKQIIVGYTRDNKPIRAEALNAQGSMTVLMKEALKPNLVQSLEQTPTLVHGGPFANIAHGCNSVIATKTALKLADYVVTEAGFGADLGAEKFVDIKCRKSGLRPSAAVLVGTARALKYSGGAKIEDVNSEHTKALMKGMGNLDRHVANIRDHYGLPVIVALNRFGSDTEREFEMIKKHLGEQGVEAHRLRALREGLEGRDRAREVDGQAHRHEAGLAQVRLRGRRRALEEDRQGREEHLSRERSRRRHRRAQEDREVPRGRLRQSADLHREDAVLVLDGPAAARRADGPRVQRARRLLERRRRVHGRAVGRDHDDAGPAEEAGVRQHRHRRRRQHRRVGLRTVRSYRNAVRSGRGAPRFSSNGLGALRELVLRELQPSNIRFLQKLFALCRS